MLNHRKLYLLSSIILLSSCAPQVELTTSWSNKAAQVKNSPKIMVMALGKDLANRQYVENYMAEYLKSLGYNGVEALDVFNPNQRVDSITMVNTLRDNNIDMLLTNAVVDVKETQVYVPGTTESVPVASYPVETFPTYNAGYYYYYNQRSVYYQTQYETYTTPGYTYTDVEVLIESNLYDVATTQLLWIGQSKSYTKEPSHELFDQFSKVVVNDIVKHNLFKK